MTAPRVLPRALHRRAPLACAAAALACAAGAPSAAASDASATHAYIVADAKVVAHAAARIPHGEATLTAVLHRVRRECPGAGTNSPQNPESTMMSNEVIGLLVTSAVDTELPSIREYVRSASAIRWSRSSVNRAIHGYVGNVRTLTQLRPPDICADVRAWAATGYTRLPATTVAFDARFVPAWVALGEIPGSLSPFESTSDRALVRVAKKHESDLTEFEAREVQTWGHIMEALEINP
jgi:hypothetical protein